MGAAAHAGRSIATIAALEQAIAGAKNAAGTGASLGSYAVRVRRLRPSLAAAWDHREHEPSGESRRQRQLRKFGEDAEAGRDLREPGTGIWNICLRTSSDHRNSIINRRRLHSALGYRSL